MSKTEDAMGHADVIRNAIAILTAEGCYAWKNQTGAYKRFGVFIKYGLQGSSDIIAVLPNGRVAFIEAKVGRDKQKADQKLFATEVKKRGCPYVIVSTADDLKLLRRNARRWGKQSKK